MTYEELIDQLVIYFTQPPYDEEVASAKREFFEEAGIVDDESSHFEMRMSQFLDWYLFSRELEREHVTPAVLAGEVEIPGLGEEQKEMCQRLSNVRHSLFEFIRIKGQDIWIKDLFSGKKVHVKDSPVTIGFSRDELFEARLIPVDKTYVFTNGFCFHPSEAKKFILKEVKKVKHLEQNEHEDLMFRLLKMRYKHEQYKHIRIEYIYTNDTKMRI